MPYGTVPVLSLENEIAETDRGPVRFIPGDTGKGPADGIALCLSGGGYRAMLFHTGSLLRLSELGILAAVKRISSVSGGSIIAGQLALNWEKLISANFARCCFEEFVVDPIRELASRTIDVYAILKAPLWFGSAGKRIAKYYDEMLFDGATLQDLPDEPRFVINATNMQSGVLWRFMKPYMRDYRIGEIPKPKLKLSIAVAASSAFPPLLSPIVLPLDRHDFYHKTGLALKDPRYTENVVLADGGIYDNLGLETAWKKFKTVLVSDAGLGLKPEPTPWRNWPLQAVRTLFTIDGQVRSLRRRQLMDSYFAASRSAQHRYGAFWCIESDPNRTKLTDGLECPTDRVSELARVATRLKRLPDEIQCRLINWGYASCDLSVRQHYDPDLPPPSGFPYPKEGV